MQGSRPKILLVDDEKLIQRMTRFILEKSNYEVHVAEDGQEAEESLEDRLQALEAERDDWKAKAEAAGHKPEPTGVSKAEAEQIADDRARSALLNEHNESVLARYGDKRDVVENRFNKLAAGEKLDRAKIEELAKEAAMAAGVSRSVSDASRSVASHGTSAPDFGDGKAKQEGFADTDAGKQTRDAMGLTPDPKKK